MFRGTKLNIHISLNQTKFIMFNGIKPNKTNQIKYYCLKEI